MSDPEPGALDSGSRPDMPGSRRSMPGSRRDEPDRPDEPDGHGRPGGPVDPAGPVQGEALGGAAADSHDTGGAEGVERRSGLRNPAAAVRGLGAGTLAMEAIVLLLAVQPIRVLGGDLSGWGVGAVIVLALSAAALAGSMRRRWAWNAGAVLQVLVLSAGFLHWSLGVLGLVFGAVWAYATHVRRTLLS